MIEFVIFPEFSIKIISGSLNQDLNYTLLLYRNPKNQEYQKTNYIEINDEKKIFHRQIKKCKNNNELKKIIQNEYLKKHKILYVKSVEYHIINKNESILLLSLQNFYMCLMYNDKFIINNKQFTFYYFLNEIFYEIIKKGIFYVFTYNEQLNVFKKYKQNLILKKSIYNHFFKTIYVDDNNNVIIEVKIESCNLDDYFIKRRIKECNVFFKVNDTIIDGKQIIKENIGNYYLLPNFNSFLKQNNIKNLEFKKKTRKAEQDYIQLRSHYITDLEYYENNIENINVILSTLDL